MVGAQLRTTCFDAAKCKDRVVTSIEWSVHHPELFLAAYVLQEDGLVDQDGQVLVWNTHMTGRPEYTFTSQSAVMTAQFHPTNPKLIIGGTRSGLLVVWDCREKHAPVFRSSLARGHTHPVFALATVPVANRLHNVVSLSNDGLVCTWSDSNLGEPLREEALADRKNTTAAAAARINKSSLPSSSFYDEVLTTCFDFAGNDVNQMYLGADEGVIYKPSWSSTAEKDGGLEEWPAHDGPVTALRFHPASSSSATAAATISGAAAAGEPSVRRVHGGLMSSEFGDLFVTSSFDSTVKLWGTKGARTPLLTLEAARDYVYDVQWSPSHPAVLASGDGAGSLHFWNLVTSRDAPVHAAQVDALLGQEGTAVTKLGWSKDGKLLAAGTSSGHIALLEMDQELSVAPKETTGMLLEALHKRPIRVPR